MTQWHCMYAMRGNRHRVRWLPPLLLLALLVPEMALARNFVLDDATVELVGSLEEATVQADDTLLDLARRHNLGYREIRRANPERNVWLPGEGTAVRIPGRFILPDAPREGIVVNLSEMRLYFYPPPERGGARTVVTHPIGVGREGWLTPLGRTQISQRLEYPTWYSPASIRAAYAERGESLPAVVPPGPDNPLGDHALLLGRSGYLIHGTHKPDGIGMQVSHGCIRMFPEDIAALFDRAAIGTPVYVIDQPFKAGVADGALYVEVHEALDDGRSDDDAGEAAPSMTPLVQAVRAAAARHDEALFERVDWDRLHAAFERADGVPTRVTR